MTKYGITFLRDFLIAVHDSNFISYYDFPKWIQKKTFDSTTATLSSTLCNNTNIKVCIFFSNRIYQEIFALTHSNPFVMPFYI